MCHMPLLIPGFIVGALFYALHFEVLWLRLHQFGVYDVFNNSQKVPTIEDYAKRSLYQMKVYTVTTKDGYILKVHRISEKPENMEIIWPLECPPAKKLPILLIHGLAFSGPGMISAQNRTLATMLVDFGNDVWVYSARGTLFSRGHETLNPNQDADYWKFSYQEMGYYDMPAVVDLMLRETQSPRVMMMGFSMGNPIGVAFLEQRPLYQEKVAMFVAIAPAVYVHHIRSAPIRLLAGMSKLLEPLVKLFGIYEIFSKNVMSHFLINFTCKTPGLRMVCRLFFITLGGDEGTLAMDKYGDYLHYVPGGVSSQTLLHFGQQIKQDKCFKQYDYGAKENKKLYNSTSSPCYDLSSIKTAFCVFYGLKDILVAEEDALRFASELPNVKCKMALPFNHLDFFLGEFDTDKMYFYRSVISLHRRVSCDSYSSPGKYLK